MTTQDNNIPDKPDLESSVGMVAFLVFLLAIPAGFGLLQFAERIWPSLNERWNCGASFHGLLFSSGVFAAIGLFAACTRFRYAKITGFCLFIGLVVPWALHLLLKIAEVLLGGGI